MPHRTHAVSVISEAILTANHSIDTYKQLLLILQAEKISDISAARSVIRNHVQCLLVFPNRHSHKNDL